MTRWTVLCFDSDETPPTISHLTMMRIPKMSKPLLSGDAITVVTSCNENIKQVYHYKTNIKVELYEKNIKCIYTYQHPRSYN